MYVCAGATTSNAMGSLERRTARRATIFGGIGLLVGRALASAVLQGFGRSAAFAPMLAGGVSRSEGALA